MDEAEPRAFELACSTMCVPVKLEPILLNFVRILVVPVAGNVVPASPEKQHILAGISGPIMHETSLVHLRLLPVTCNASRRGYHGATTLVLLHAAVSNHIVRDRFGSDDYNLDDIGVGHPVGLEVGEVHDLVPVGLVIRISTVL